MKSLAVLLINPREFFEDLPPEQKSLKTPFLIVTFFALTVAATAYLMAGPMTALMENAVQGIGALMVIAVVAGAFLWAFIVCLIWAGVIHVLSAAFKGTGGFNRTLQCIGYGYLPQIAGSLISLVLAVIYVPQIRIPVLPATDNPEVIQMVVTELMQDPALHEFTLFSSALSLLFLLWSANIWIFGIQRVRQIPLKAAAVSVGLPVLAYIIYVVYTLSVV